MRKITKADVGRRVKLRNEWIAQITSFDESHKFPVSVGCLGRFNIEGKVYDDEEISIDIIAFLKPRKRRKPCVMSMYPSSIWRWRSPTSPRRQPPEGFASPSG